MPELPEVETIRRSLEPLILGRRILDFQSYSPEVFQDLSGQGLRGLIFRRLRRRGKYLLFDLAELVTEPGHSSAELRDLATLVIHLRMTGKLLFQEPCGTSGPHRRATFELSAADYITPSKICNDIHTSCCHDIVGQTPYSRDISPNEISQKTAPSALLHYDDIRRFGRITLIPFGQEALLSGLAALGPEPLSDAFNATDFQKALYKHPSQAIKSVLLDQHAVAGLGNIYCDEVLFRAGINPLRPAADLSPVECKRLASLIPPLLEEAIGLGGSSFRDYVNGLGVKGEFQIQLRVYQRGGQACVNCGTEIERCVVGGRSTHFCPKCQKMKRKRKVNPS